MQPLLRPSTCSCYSAVRENSAQTQPPMSQKLDADKSGGASAPPPPPPPGSSSGWVTTLIFLIAVGRLVTWRELSSLGYCRSHSTQAPPNTHACQNQLLFAKRHRGIWLVGRLAMLQKACLHPERRAAILPQNVVKGGSVDCLGDMTSNHVGLNDETKTWRCHIGFASISFSRDYFLRSLQILTWPLHRTFSMFRLAMLVNSLRD